MGNINEHIESFLDYYCSLPYSPEYAVMLKGLWGCGKTWFINQYFEKIKQKGIKYIYVSLYGITTIAEIENQFLQQLHPRLSSKGMEWTIKLLKSGLDSISGLDIPDTEIPDFLKNTDGYLLIFDDLERCSIKVHDLLGYINNFVEHKKNKVIIIGDEDKIINQDSSFEEAKSYQKIKEKLIGKTFQVKADVDDALNHFISQIQHEGTKIFLEKNKALIIELYDMSGYKNLRHIKQSLWDFERLFKGLPIKISEKEDLTQQVLRLFLAFSFDNTSDSFLKIRLQCQITY